MKIYAISGLGADKRVFQYLNLTYELIPIDWIQPENDENLTGYAGRLAGKIDTHEKFILIGVSFGGIIAIEISKIVKPGLLLLISSAEVKGDLRVIYRLIGKTGLIKWIPAVFFRPPEKIARWVFGAKNKKLLHQILEDTNLTFAKWAITRIITWENITRCDHCIKIHGSKDRLIPLTEDENTIVIPGGHHFMVVDKADKISQILNTEIKQAIEKVRDTQK